MSFSGDVKEELSRQVANARHCNIAEIAAIISLCGKVTLNYDKNDYKIIISTENTTIARKYFTLVKKTFNINTEVLIRRNAYLRRNRSYILKIQGKEKVTKILTTEKMIDDNGEFLNDNLANGLIIQKSCCRRAFLRGAFLAAGSISDPEKFYHFEIVCPTLEKAKGLVNIITGFGVEAKIVPRKKNHVVYVKEGAVIVELLNIMEAHISLMNLENIRIVKEMRNSVNRKVNCETANINKTVSAAVRQIDAIKFIQAKKGLDSLPANLEEIAILRLENPEVALKELGQMLNPPVGKSGVNHRLRKIIEIADELR
ncbi:hypothetical protein SAMN05216249_10657 [Acetitomaculum ruminis DSM 5522]|uniref:Probable cell division protein WhiA n=1 Tax=Acetitomaculum ruminis DSM 5522 TaxID=1120918 RepID=A0A1I0XCL9_9FIRM|nr:DNA-binding protein WhiA [Acetitomaculum ruminis]SFA98070.1 hypothetical protein SAMN05216249_10657 [Acetitomaculum ruminis DSM 5522]